MDERKKRGERGRSVNIGGMADLMKRKRKKEGGLEEDGGDMFRKSKKATRLLQGERTGKKRSTNEMIKILRGIREQGKL